MHLSSFIFHYTFKMWTSGRQLKIIRKVQWRQIGGRAAPWAAEISSNKMQHQTLNTKLNQVQTGGQQSWELACNYAELIKHIDWSVITHPIRSYFLKIRVNCKCNPKMTGTVTAVTRTALEGYMPLIVTEQLKRTSIQKRCVRIPEEISTCVKTS